MKHEMTNKEYGEYVKKKTPNSAILKNCVKAFLIGGLICAIGEGFIQLYQALGANEESAAIFESITLIFLSALLTGLNIYPKIAKHAGAGTVVPITGFANSVVSPALDAKTEGMILGTGAKIFTVAGPVILYGTLASWVIGLIYWVTSMIK